MPTDQPEIFAALCAPFEPSEVKNRADGRGGRLHYITAKSAMNRLDTVMGPEHWRCSYRETAKGVVCTIELRVQGEWIAKEDAGGYSDMEKKTRDGRFVPDDENTIKSGYSDAFKRSAACWGVGRYLSQDGVPDFGGEDHHQEPPQARNEARGEAPRGHQQAQANGHRDPEPQRQERPHGAPKSGKALYAWANELSDRDAGRDVFAFLIAYGKTNGYPDRIVEWSEAQVANAYMVASLEFSLPLSGTGIPQKQHEPREGVTDVRELARRNPRPKSVEPYGWLKDCEQAFGIQLLRPWTDVAKERGWPWKTNELEPDQLAEMRAWVIGRIKASPSYRGEFDDRDGSEAAHRDHTDQESRIRDLRNTLFKRIEEVVKVQDGVMVAGHAQMRGTYMALCGSYPGARMAGDDELRTCKNVDLLQHCCLLVEKELSLIHPTTNGATN